MASKKTGLGDKPVILTPGDIKNAAVYNDITWFAKRRLGYSKFDISKDVGVNFGKHNISSKAHKKEYSINFSFRNHIEKVWGDDKQYVIFGVVKNRIYFKSFDDSTGYKVTKRGTTAGLSVGITREDKAALEPFCPGEYHLKYDEFQELYYIEREE